MKKVIALLLILIFLIIPLGACMDAHEVNTWTFPYMIGIDKGVADKLRFTVLLPTLKGSSQGAGGGEAKQGEGSTTVISIDCPTLISGMLQINSFLSRRLNYTHAELFIIGEEMARQGITSFFEGMRMERQIRMDLSVIVVKGEASKFIEAFKPILGKSIAGVITGFLSSSEQTGFMEEETFLDVLHALKSGDDSVSCTLGAVTDYSRYLPAGSEIEKIEAHDLLPGQIARIGGNPIELLGAAVFNGDRLAGELDLGETRALLIVKGEFISGSMTIDDPLDEDLYITSRIEPIRGPDISVTTAGETPVIDIKVYMQGSIRNQQSEIDYLEPSLLPVLDRAYAEYITSEIGKTIKKCQEWGSDIFKFSESARRNFWTIPDWEAYDWRHRFPDAQVNIEVMFNMLRTGIVIDNNPVQNAEAGR